MIEADLDMFENKILVESEDSVVFFYSTETINFRQRFEAYQVNRVAGLFMSLPEVNGKVHFYSYDTGQNEFPEGIPHMLPPPTDLTGEGTENLSGLPAIYFFPSGDKSMPYTNVMKEIYGFKIIEYIKDLSPHNLKINMNKYKEFGVTKNDQQTFVVYCAGEKAMDIDFSKNPNADPEMMKKAK